MTPGNQKNPTTTIENSEASQRRQGGNPGKKAKGKKKISAAGVPKKGRVDRIQNEMIEQKRCPADDYVSLHNN